MRIGFVGLGQMGRAMARRLLDAGHAVTVWNRSPAPGEALRARGATLAARVEDAFDTEVVISMLADDRAVQAVWLDSGLVARLPRACIHLNMATVGLDVAIRMAAAHADRGAGYVAAPVFGRPEVAASGGLDIVAAGAPELLERCEPLFAALGRRSFGIGARPEAASALRTFSPTSTLRKSLAERLTDTQISVGQRAHSAQAVCSTKELISETTPISSASGMNTAGEMGPRSR